MILGQLQQHRFTALLLILVASKQCAPDRQRLRWRQRCSLQTKFSGSAITKLCQGGGELQTLLLLKSLACYVATGLAKQTLRSWPAGSPTGQMKGIGLNQSLIGVVRQFRGGRQSGWMGGLKSEQLLPQLRLVISKVIAGIGTGR